MMLIIYYVQKLSDEKMTDIFILLTKMNNLYIYI